MRTERPARRQPARRPSPRRPWLYAAAILLALSVAAVCLGAEQDADEAQRLQTAIRDQEARAKSGKVELQKLTQEERSLYGELAGLEDRIASLEDSIEEQEHDLARLRAEQARAARDYEEQAQERERSVAELEGLLKELWPLHLSALAGRSEGLTSWDKADREFAWLSDIYQQASLKHAAVVEQTRRLDERRAAQERLVAEAEERLRAINEGKDEVLSDKLAFLRKIQVVRASKLDREEELGQILGTIDKLNYQLGVLSSRDIDQQKGKLPWPAPGGKIVARFVPDGRPPCRGLGLSLPEDTQVRAVSRGKVVHNDTLRGFGRVVILYHGHDYYTLYAYLDGSSVKVGQQIEGGQVLGEAGYYPEAKGTGLYFELRFRQKAINPESWLIATK